MLLSRSFVVMQRKTKPFLQQRYPLLKVAPLCSHIIGLSYSPLYPISQCFTFWGMSYTLYIFFVSCFQGQLLREQIGNWNNYIFGWSQYEAFSVHMHWSWITLMYHTFHGIPLIVIECILKAEEDYLGHVACSLYTACGESEKDV